MIHAHEMTFGGADLDRAHEVRRDPAALAALWAGPAARVAVFWRGKPLIAGEAGQAVLATLPPGHPVLAEAREAAIFLARSGEGGIWAQDISAWEPESGDLATIRACPTGSALPSCGPA